MATADELQELALRLSAFTDTLTRHAERLVQDNQQAAQGLLETSRQFSAQSATLARQLVQTIATESRSAIERGSAEGMRGASDQLQRASAEIGRSATALERQREQLAAAQRSLVWKAGLALVLGSLLATGTCAFTAWRTQQFMASNALPRELIEATQNGTLSRCGNALCARIGAKPRLHGDDGQYAELR